MDTAGPARPERTGGKRAGAGGLLDRLATGARHGTPGRPTGTMTWLLGRVLGPVLRVAFRPSISGAGHVPPDRSVLIVANHSGSGVAEVLALALLVLDGRVTARPLTGLAHPLAFRIPGVAWCLRGLGAVPSTYEAADAALAEGVSVIVFPGGDHEAFRPLWQARDVDFAGRKGFLRIARSAWVPVVPLGIAGSHATVPILWRSRALPWLLVLPRLVGLKRLPITALWLAGLATIATLAEDAAAAGWLALAWSLFPIPYFVPIVPSAIRLAAGEPIEPGDLFGARGADGPLDEAYERVRSAVEGLVRDEGRG